MLVAVACLTLWAAPALAIYPDKMGAGGNNAPAGPRYVQTESGIYVQQDAAYRQAAARAAAQQQTFASEQLGRTMRRVASHAEAAAVGAATTAAASAAADHYRSHRDSNISGKYTARLTYTHDRAREIRLTREQAEFARRTVGE